MYVAKHAVSRRKGRLWASLLLPGGVLYLEILLRLFDTDNDFWTWGLLRTVFFSLAAGVLIYALLILVLFRTFSRNLPKRRAENQKWVNWWQARKNAVAGAKARHADTAHKYFTCKTCKTICRVPVGKGKIEITCPKCGGKIIAKT